MFKYRIKAWKLEKSIRPDEALQMARVRARREAKGVGSEFWKHGHRINAVDFERYLRNHPRVVDELKRNIPHDQLMKGHIEALLPPHIVVLTPPEPLRLDQALHSIENMLLMQRNHLNSVALSPEWAATVSQRHAGTWLAEAMNIIDENGSSQLLNEHEVGYMIQRGFSSILPFFQADDPLFIIGILSAALEARDTSEYREIGQMLLNHVRDLCLVMKGTGHPFSVIISTLLGFQDDPRKQAHSIKLLTRMVDEFFTSHVGLPDSTRILVYDLLSDVMARLPGDHIEGLVTKLDRYAESWLYKTSCEDLASPVSVYAIVNLYVDRDQEAAISWLERVRQTNPRDLLSRVILAMLHLENGSRREYVSLLRETMVIWRKIGTRDCTLRDLQTHGIDMLFAFTAMTRSPPLSNLGYANLELLTLLKSFCQEIWRDMALTPDLELQDNRGRADEAKMMESDFVC